MGHPVYIIVLTHNTSIKSIYEIMGGDFNQTILIKTIRVSRYHVRFRRHSSVTLCLRCCPGPGNSLISHRYLSWNESEASEQSSPHLDHAKLGQQIKSKIGNVSKPSLCGHKKKEAQLLTRNYCCNWSTFYTGSNLLPIYRVY